MNKQTKKKKEYKKERKKERKKENARKKLLSRDGKKPFLVLCS